MCMVSRDGSDPKNNEAAAGINGLRVKPLSSDPEFVNSNPVMHKIFFFLIIFTFVQA